LVTVPFWVYWTSPKKVAIIDHKNLSWLGDVKNGDTSHDPCYTHQLGTVKFHHVLSSASCPAPLPAYFLQIFGAVSDYESWFGKGFHELRQLVIAGVSEDWVIFSSIIQ